MKAETKSAILHFADVVTEALCILQNGKSINKEYLLAAEARLNEAMKEEET